MTDNYKRQNFQLEIESDSAKIFAGGAELGRPGFYLEIQTPSLNDLNSRVMNDIEPNIALIIPKLSSPSIVQTASSSQVFS